MMIGMHKCFDSRTRLCVDFYLNYIINFSPKPHCAGLPSSQFVVNIIFYVN